MKLSWYHLSRLVDQYPCNVYVHCCISVRCQYGDYVTSGFDDLLLQEKESWDINTQEKIEAAGKKKEEGNVLFKAGKYVRASKRYEKVCKCYAHVGL